MQSPAHPVVTVYERALRTGSLESEDGRTLPIRRWLREADPADHDLLDRCTGPTLDVGCGPGRMAAALAGRGVPCLGIDISARAVSMTNERGGLALRRDIFAATPGERRWQHVLLADGNIGIGGDPVRLLARCAALLSPHGTVLLDLDGPGSGLVTSLTRLHSDGMRSRPFRWSRLGVDALAAVAAPACLVPQHVWQCGERWRATLTPIDDWSAPRRAA